jgi:hypothetical protein
MVEATVPFFVGWEAEDSSSDEVVFFVGLVVREGVGVKQYVWTLGGARDAESGYLRRCRGEHLGQSFIADI